MLSKTNSAVKLHSSPDPFTLHISCSATNTARHIYQFDISATKLRMGLKRLIIYKGKIEAQTISKDVHGLGLHSATDLWPGLSKYSGGSILDVVAKIVKLKCLIDTERKEAKCFNERAFRGIVNYTESHGKVYW